MYSRRLAKLLRPSSRGSTARPPTASGLFLRLDGSAEGAVQSPARHGGDQRTLWRARCGGKTRPSALPRGQAFFAKALAKTDDSPSGQAERRSSDDRRPDGPTRRSRTSEIQAHALYGRAPLYAAQVASLERNANSSSSARCVSAGRALAAEYSGGKEKTVTVILDGMAQRVPAHSLANRLDDHRPGTSGKAPSRATM